MNQYKQAAEQVATNERVARQLSKENRAFLLNKARVLGVGLVHVFDKEDPMGGLTIAFKPRTDYKSNTMVEVAVVTCSKMDNFSKSIGTARALDAFFNGITIDLPLMLHYNRKNLPFAVKEAFSPMYSAV